jgi:hypothetical protein
MPIPPGPFVKIGPTTTTFSKDRELTRIRSNQRERQAELAEEQRQFAIRPAFLNRVLGIWESLRQQGGGSGAFGGIPELRERAELFRPGGQFGAGGKAEVERGGQQAIAAGQIGLAQTGVSSGTNVAGLRARVLADTALARKKIEDERVGGLSASLQSIADARLAQQEFASQERRALFGSLPSLRF